TKWLHVKGVFWAQSGPVLSYRQPAQIGFEQLGWNMSGRVKLAIWFSIYFLVYPGIACAQQQVIGAPPEALNMKLVGTSDLQARSGYHPTIQPQAVRWLP